MIRIATKYQYRNLYALARMIEDLGWDCHSSRVNSVMAHMSLASLKENVLVLNANFGSCLFQQKDAKFQRGYLEYVACSAMNQEHSDFGFSLVEMLPMAGDRRNWKFMRGKDPYCLSDFVSNFGMQPQDVVNGFFRFKYTRSAKEIGAELRKNIEANKPS